MKPGQNFKYASRFVGQPHFENPSSRRMCCFIVFYMFIC